MHPRIRLLILSATIATLAITLIVFAFHFFTRGTSLYDAGRMLLGTGVVLVVFTLPLFYRSHHRARIRIRLHLSVEERNKIVPDPYYDVFAGMALATILTTVLGYGLVATASKLERRQLSDTYVPFIGSIRSELPNLQKPAFKWQSDAYLVGVEYNFGSQPSYENRLISADFRSSSKPNTLLVVNVTTDGNYTQNFYQLNTSLNLYQPILENDWTIDSQEALSVFAQDDDVRSCLSFARPKKLELTRSFSTEQNVKWCLSIDECSVIPYRICIDAVTGEEISLEH